MSCKQPGVYGLIGYWFIYRPITRYATHPLGTNNTSIVSQNHLSMTAIPRFILASATLIAASQAFNIASPAEGSTVDTTSNWNIDWTNNSPHVNYKELSFTIASLEVSQYLINASTTAGQVVVPGGRVVIPSRSNCTIHVNSPRDEGNAFIASSSDFTVPGHSSVHDHNCWRSSCNKR